MDRTVPPRQRPADLAEYLEALSREPVPGYDTWQAER
jgi:hypothetical protein